MARTISLDDAIQLTSQLQFTGNGYLDAKMQPVPELADLNDIPLAQRFKGLTVTVLDDGSGVPHDYWLKTSTRKWVKKDDYASSEELENIDERLIAAESGVTMINETVIAVESAVTELNERMTVVESAHTISGDDYDVNN